jgi:hypothetical protein
MNLQYLPSENYLSATDDVITEYAADTTLYPSVEMTTTLDCGTPCVISYASSVITDPTNSFYLDIPNNQFVVPPGMFALTAFIDGVYRVDIKFIQPNGFTRIYNCIFIDMTFKCQLANLLSGLQDGDIASETAHLLHYSLVNGSNCGCACDDMCENFIALETILVNQPAKATDCGCS